MSLPFESYPFINACIKEGLRRATQEVVDLKLTRWANMPEKANHEEKRPMYDEGIVSDVDLEIRRRGAKGLDKHGAFPSKEAFLECLGKYRERIYPNLSDEAFADLVMSIAAIARTWVIGYRDVQSEHRSWMRRIYYAVQSAYGGGFTIRGVYDFAGGRLHVQFFGDDWTYILVARSDSPAQLHLYAAQCSIDEENPVPAWCVVYSRAVGDRIVAPDTMRLIKAQIDGHRASRGKSSKPANAQPNAEAEEENKFIVGPDALARWMKVWGYVREDFQRGEIGPIHNEYFDILICGAAGTINCRIRREGENIYVKVREASEGWFGPFAMTDMGIRTMCDFLFDRATNEDRRVRRERRGA